MEGAFAEGLRGLCQATEGGKAHAAEAGTGDQPTVTDGIGTVHKTADCNWPAKMVVKESKIRGHTTGRANPGQELNAEALELATHVCDRVNELKREEDELERKKEDELERKKEDDSPSSPGLVKQPPGGGKPSRLRGLGMRLGLALSTTKTKTYVEDCKKALAEIFKVGESAKAECKAMQLVHSEDTKLDAKLASLIPRCYGYTTVYVADHKRTSETKKSLEHHVMEYLSYRTKNTLLFMEPAFADVKKPPTLEAFISGLAGKDEKLVAAARMLAAALFHSGRALQALHFAGYYHLDFHPGAGAAAARL